jgi:hypothetical protein
MAYLTKSQYDYRRESAAHRNAENKKIKTITDMQHDLLAEIAEMRHKIHSSRDSMYYNDNNRYWNWLNDSDESINNRRNYAVGKPEVIIITYFEYNLTIIGKYYFEVLQI